MSTMTTSAETIPAPRAWIVQAEHWEVPGVPAFVFLSEEGANAKAADMVNGLISEALEATRWDDIALKADADAKSWGERLKHLRQFISDGFEDRYRPDQGAIDTECDVWVITAPLAA